jgi:hypothetical protein
MTHRRAAWLAMLMVTAMLTPGCAVFKRQPPPAPVPPPAMAESRPTQMPAERVLSPRHGLLTRAAMAVSVGLEAGGDALLEEFLRSGPVAGPEARARALVLRALLARNQGGERGERMAKAYLQAALQANPGGVNAGIIALTLDLLAALEKESGELARTRAELGASRERERQQAGAAKALRTEVESLALQLEELKAIHLQIESGKEDTPSH